MGAAQSPRGPEGALDANHVHRHGDVARGIRRNRRRDPEVGAHIGALHVLVRRPVRHGRRSVYDLSEPTRAWRIVKVRPGMTKIQADGAAVAFVTDGERGACDDHPVALHWSDPKILSVR